MAAFDYSKSVDTATRLITKFGQSMILRVVTEGAYDPAIGESTSTSVDVSVNGAVFDLSGRFIGNSLQNGTLAKSTDKSCLLSVGNTPNLLDKIIIGAEIFLIINIKVLNPGGTDVFFDLVLRSG